MVTEIMVAQEELAQNLAKYASQFDRILALSAGELLLYGELLSAAERISADQLEKAHLRQSHAGRRLGVELVSAGAASKGQVDTGVQFQRKFIFYALAVSAGLAPLDRSAMAGNYPAMGVSATVVANARLQMDFQPVFLSISVNDVAQGYVDVAAASRFSVHTNSRSGYLMEFFPVGNLFVSVQIGGFNGAVLLGPDGGAVVQRAPLAPAFAHAHALSFRFALSADTHPGVYRWPLQMAVRAL